MNHFIASTSPSKSTSKLIAAVTYLAFGYLAFSGSTAVAQSACSSDGVPAPRVLQERFTSADCETCWGTNPAKAANRRSVALDWLVPSAQGDDAPLSAVASQDALVRLESLGNPALASDKTWQRDAASKTGKLRVAMGPAVGGYVGASIAWKPAFKTVPGSDHWTAWLALVETVPAGTEGTPVERNLVRNLLISTWDGQKKLSKKEHLTFLESRSLSVPAGARAERLRVVGWVENAGQRMLAVAQSRCTTPKL
jgi:hypothetical protein